MFNIPFCSRCIISCFRVRKSQASIQFAVDDQANLFQNNPIAAHKVSGREFVGLSAWSVAASGTGDASFPLMALIDWCGFRLVAMSHLPIDEDTLMLGSQDAGASVLNKDEDLKEAVDRIAADMNLAMHCVSNGVRMRAPADLEVHRGRDGRAYLIDFSRSMPPRAGDHKGEVCRILVSKIPLTMFL